MADVCFVCVYLRDMSLFVRCNGVYRRHFGTNPPSRYEQAHSPIARGGGCSFPLRARRLCVQMPLDADVHILLECFGQQRHPQVRSFPRRPSTVSAIATDTL